MGRHSLRVTVEECPSISTKFLKDSQYFDDYTRDGFISWSKGKRHLGKVYFTVSTCPGNEYVDFEMKDNISLVYTRPFFGGRRWWFKCRCGRRVGILYFLEGLIRCRKCFDLTYASCKESHKFDALNSFLKNRLGGI